jgi:hypothetical protein
LRDIAHSGGDHKADSSKSPDFNAIFCLKLVAFKLLVGAPDSPCMGHFGRRINAQILTKTFALSDNGPWYWNWSALWFCEGAYSAICLLMLPLLVALTGASIVADFSGTAAQTGVEEKAVVAKTSALGSSTSWRRPSVQVGN